MITCCIPVAAATSRILKGTVSHNGKPASGVLVTVHRSCASYFTSFDGKYELKVSSKSLWIRFTLAGTTIQKELEPNGSDYLDVTFPPATKAGQPVLTDSIKGKQPPRPLKNTNKQDDQR
jgi:hypothetical protein